MNASETSDANSKKPKTRLAVTMPGVKQLTVVSGLGRSGPSPEGSQSRERSEEGAIEAVLQHAKWSSDGREAYAASALEQQLGIIQEKPPPRSHTQQA